MIFLPEFGWNENFRKRKIISFTTAWSSQTMKLLQSLVTFAYLAQSHVIEIPAQTLSDGANCIWVAGSYGQRVHCPDSSIAVGSCTSNYRSECDNGKYFHMLNCCDIGKREKPQDCHTVHNNDGLRIHNPTTIIADFTTRVGLRYRKPLYS